MREISFHFTKVFSISRHLYFSSLYPEALRHTAQRRQNGSKSERPLLQSELKMLLEMQPDIRVMFRFRVNLQKVQVPWKKLGGHTGYSGCELEKCELKSNQMLWFLACCGIAAWCKKIAFEIAHHWTEDQQFSGVSRKETWPTTGLDYLYSLSWNLPTFSGWETLLFHPVLRSKQLPAKRLPQRKRSLRQELEQWQNLLSSLRVWNWQWRWKTPCWKFKANVNLISWWNSTRIQSPGRRKKQLT